MRWGSKAKAKAKEEKTKENATAADQTGISRESALNPTRTRARDSEENATTAEKLDIQPANAQRTKEMQREPGANEDTEELGAKEAQRKGKGLWQVDGVETQGDFDWNHQTEDQSGKEAIVVDQDR